MLEEWKCGVICPILKKGDKTVCNNYGGISLLCTTYKVLARILAMILEPYAEEIIGEYKCGFRRNRATTDQIFSIRMMLEKCYENNINLHHLFIDYKQAYDSVYRKSLYEIMREFCIPQKLINLVKMALTDTVS
jgi:hypothetical protein